MLPTEIKSEPISPIAILLNQKGRIGYVIAWLLGVPTSLLIFIFLIRGH